MTKLVSLNNFMAIEETAEQKKVMYNIYKYFSTISNKVLGNVFYTGEVQQTRELREHGYFCGDLIEKEIILFVFVDKIQVELDDFSLLWNTHYIRKIHNELIAYGSPDLMYTVPAMFNTRDYSIPVDVVAVNVYEEECIFKTRIHCDKDVHDVCRLHMEENNWSMPEDANSARNLYLNLR
ncbi:hypothetical protein KUTeg_020480 [Tegillarca granosa]|uniref:Uncharacterized protein n=1 Tax=Tegillarca granosa TaxID=220873 RepID=A0ABQ9E807_TEGGR|nr:hypothetical protein KUTeg_020480 [Tegillarca granosa]